MVKLSGYMIRCLFVHQLRLNMEHYWQVSINTPAHSEACLICELGLK